MHGDSFLLAPPSMILLQDVRSLDRFPICLEACNRLIEMYKSLFGKATICLTLLFDFNVTLILHGPNFDDFFHKLIATQ